MEARNRTTYRERPSGRQPSEDYISDGRSLGELFTELIRETRMLVRQEINLAKTEASEKVSEAGKDLAFIGAGGAVAYAGFIVFVTGLALLLATIMSDGMAFVVAGGAVVLAGYGLVQKGLSALRQTNFTLERTAETLQEDKQWMKRETKGIKEHRSQAVAGENRRKTAR